MNDCNNCINRKHPFTKGYCRTMSVKPSELSCHMTKAQAIKVENEIIKDGRSFDATAQAKGMIKWLNKLEG